MIFACEIICYRQIHPILPFNIPITSQADALQEVAVKYLGVSSAGSRGVVRAEHVSRDEAGLRELLRTGYLRAAVNLTHVLISAAGQGKGIGGLLFQPFFGHDGPF